MISLGPGFVFIDGTNNLIPKFGCKGNGELCIEILKGKTCNKIKIPLFGILKLSEFEVLAFAFQKGNLAEIASVIKEIVS